MVYFNREKYLAYHRKYYYEHRKERKPHDLECRKNYKRKVKLQILEHYGSKCNCCGEININFLTIHHINGRHDKTKKEDKHSGFVLWNWLRLNNYPKGFQLLCYNCNCSMKHHMKQYCPVHHPELYLFSKAQNTHYFRFQQIGFQRRRQEVIKHYGNKCNCCGESHLEFLTIDHIQHSNKGLYGERLYRYLIRNNFPNGYQVLCWNCNSLKANLDNELCYVHHPEVYGSKPSRII